VSLSARLPLYVFFSSHASHLPFSLSFSFHDTPPTEIYTLSLHDALPIWVIPVIFAMAFFMLPQTLTLFFPDQNWAQTVARFAERSEEHTSELQSRFDLVCRLLLEKKKKKIDTQNTHVAQRSHTHAYTGAS